MKQLPTQQHSHHNSKVWASLDCLLTALPITPLTRTSIVMRSNGNLPITDSRRISPQTTSSSGYHSDLSSATSANESPQSVHETLPITFEKSSLSSSQLPKKTILITDTSTYEKPLPSKNLARISSFIRKQYERAKSKLISKPPTSSSHVPIPTIRTCSKATSTTPLSHLSEDNYTLANQQKQHSRCNTKPHYHQQYLSSVYKQSSFTEPVYSVYVHSLHDDRVKITAPAPAPAPSLQQKNYASIHECYSHQPSFHHAAMNKSNQCASSYRRLASLSNFENNNYHIRRHHYYPVESSLSSSSSCQNYYPYRYTNNNYDYTRSNYVPLSDLFSRKTSAFKPIEPKAKPFHQRPSYNIYEQVPPSDDPCDQEVAQYFPQTSQWSNPNYFDIYSKDPNPPKQIYSETLC